MGKMSIEAAVNFCLTHKAVIRAPRLITYKRIVRYLKRNGFLSGDGMSISDTLRWYSMENFTAIGVKNKRISDFGSYEYFKLYGYEIINVA